MYLGASALAYLGWQGAGWLPGVALFITQIPAGTVLVGVFLRGRHLVAHARAGAPAGAMTPAPRPPNRAPVEVELAVPVGASLAAVVSLDEHREQRRAA